MDGLARAELDLARGDVRLARERLKGLVTSRPHDREVRALLAEAYRRDRQWPEAGRWGYLVADAASDRERTAFERHCGRQGRLTEARLRRLLRSDRLAPLADASGRQRVRSLPRGRLAGLLARWRWR